MRARASHLLEVVLAAAVPVLAMLAVTAAVLDLQERVAAGDEGARVRVEELAELLRK